MLPVITADIGGGSDNALQIIDHMRQCQPRPVNTLGHAPHPGARLGRNRLKPPADRAQISRPTVKRRHSPGAARQ